MGLLFVVLHLDLFLYNQLASFAKLDIVIMVFYLKNIRILNY